jgi:hypothetical protein
MGATWAPWADRVRQKNIKLAVRLMPKSRDQGHGLFFNSHQVHRSINKAILPANGKV